MSTTSAARPEDLQDYRTLNETERLRLELRLLEARTAVEHARANASTEWTWSWQVDLALPGVLAVGDRSLDGAVVEVRGWADFDAWVGVVAEAFRDAGGGDSLARVGDRELIRAIPAIDRDRLLGAVTPPAARLATELTRLLGMTEDVDRGETSRMARRAADRWAHDLGRNPTETGEARDAAWGVVESEFARNGFSLHDARLILDRLSSARASLIAHLDDPEYNAALLRSLGTDDLIGLTDLAGQVVWVARGGGDERLEADARRFATLLSNVLASGSHALDETWSDEFVESLIGDDGVFDDAALGLLLAGELAPHTAEAVGRLGIGLLVGRTAAGREIGVRKGEGSVWLDGFDDLRTAWRARGAVLIEAAARSPEGAGRILADAANVRALVDADLGRRSNRIAPDAAADWEEVGASVSALIEAAAVIDARRDPSAAREIAAEVIAAVLAEDYDALMFSDRHPAFGRALASIGALYTPEFAVNILPNPTGVSVGENRSTGPYVWVDRPAATNFLALAARSTRGAEQLIDASETYIEGLVAAAWNTERPELIQRAAYISAYVETAVSYSNRVVAIETDRRNRRSNERLGDVVSTTGGAVRGVVPGGTVATVIGVVISGLQGRVVSAIGRSTDNERRAVQEVRDRAGQLQEFREESIVRLYLEYLRQIDAARQTEPPTDAVEEHIDRVNALARDHLGIEAADRWRSSGDLRATADDIGSFITAVLAEPLPSATLARFLDALATLDPPAPTVLPGG